MRLQALPWVQDRLSALGASFVPRNGQWCMPVVEAERLPQCAFLDPDGLCSIHKREGVEATPLTCRTFPFGFIQEPGGLRPYLSHLCPSIRDNTGDLLTPQWESKLAFLPPPFPLAPRMGVGLHALDTPALLRWGGQAATLLRSAPSLASGLEQLAGWTSSIAVLEASAAVQPGSWPAPPTPRPSVSAPAAEWPGSLRLLLGLLLLPLGHPMRLHMRLHGTGRLRLYAGAAAFIRRFRRFSGSVDLMFTPGPALLEEAAAIPAPAAGTPEHSRITDFTAGLLDRRSLFLKESSLEQAVFRLALAASLVSWFARLHAAARSPGAPGVVTRADVGEGLSACEYVLTYHGCMLDSHPAGRALVQFLAAYPPAFQRLLQAI